MFGGQITWGNVIVWLVIIGGWVVVHRLSLGRERRKENRDTVDLLIETINEIESEAINFHCAKKFDGNASQSLAGRIQRLAKKIQRHPLCKLKIDDDCIIRFRQSITLYNAELSRFQQQDYTSDVVKRIRDESGSLIDALEEGKNRYFK